MTTLTTDVTEVKPMNDDSINDERIDDHLAAIDAAMSDPEHLQAMVIAVAATRGFTVRFWKRMITLECWPATNSLKSYSYNGPVESPEVLLDLIAFFENSEEPMNIYSTDLFKYLSGDMIGQNTIVLTITKFTEEKMSAGGRGEQIKQCLHFKERDKTMVLNKTNANAIAKVLGPETDQWPGGRITLAAPVIDAFGQQRRAIRVIEVEPPDVPNKPRGNGNS